eukprot:3084705-Pleurochrysis_carterae.AAC.3
MRSCTSAYSPQLIAPGSGAPEPLRSSSSMAISDSSIPSIADAILSRDRASIFSTSATACSESIILQRSKENWT